MMMIMIATGEIDGDNNDDDDDDDIIAIMRPSFTSFLVHFF